MKKNEGGALVVKFGGSEATGMEGARIDYLHDFLNYLGVDLLNSYDHVGLVIGGGPKVRALQANVQGDSAKNLIARDVMWEHAESLRQVAQSIGLDTVKSVPHSPEEMNYILSRDGNKVITMSWLKDKQSSDASSILLAEKWKQEVKEVEIVVLSNIAYIFTHNPSEVATARAITRSNVRKLVTEKVLSDNPGSFVPGGHVVIDAVAVSRLIKRSNGNMPLFFGHGNNPINARQFLVKQEPSQGTILSDRYPKTIYLSE